MDSESKTVGEVFYDNIPDVHSERTNATFKAELFHEFYCKLGEGDKAEQKILSKIGKILRRPDADVNAADNNNYSNTILHIAAEMGYTKIVKHLLDKPNIDLGRKNCKEETPLDLANNHKHHEVVKLLETAVQKKKNMYENETTTEKCTRPKTVKCANADTSIASEENQSHSVCDIPSTSKSNPTQETPCGLAGLYHGILFQFHIIMLFICRGLSCKLDYHLAAERPEAGKFDDVIFKYKCQKSEEVVHLFAQVKHFENKSYTISWKDLLGKTGKKLGLEMYFQSFLKIKKDAKFPGSLKTYYICTNVDFDCDLKLSSTEVDKSENHIFLEGTQYTVDIQTKLDLYENLKEKYNQEDIDDFCQNLVFVVNMPEEDTLFSTINEYGESEPFLSGLSKTSLLSEVENWIDKENGVFLSAEEWNKRKNHLQTLVSEEFCIALTQKNLMQLESYEILFKKSSDLCTVLCNVMTEGIHFINIVAETDVQLTAAKVYQNLEGCENINFLFINSQSLKIEKLREHIFQCIISSDNMKVFVIFTQNEKELVIATCEHLFAISGIKNKIIVLISEGMPLFQHNNSSTIHDKVTFEDLKDLSQERFLSTKISFQGSWLCLREVGLTPKMVDSETLVELCKKSDIAIGDQKLTDIEEIDDYWIDREFLSQEIRAHILTDRNNFEYFVVEISEFDYQIGKFEDNHIDRAFQSPETKPHVFIARNNFEHFIVQKTSELNDLIEKLEDCYIDTFRSAEFKEHILTAINSVDYFIVRKSELDDQIEKFFSFQCHQYPDRNIHWLIYDHCKLLWHKSRGSVSELYNYLKDQENRDILPEFNFLKTVHDAKVVVISDTAGMGKSTILTKLAKTLTEKSPCLWVQRIDLNDHTKIFEERLVNPEDGRYSTEKSIHFLSRSLLRYENLSLKLFEERCQKTGAIVLMFDGFDEISPVYKNKVCGLIQALQTSAVDQIWITTRPNMSQFLESSFSLLAYTLKPFSVADQINFLTKFWKIEAKCSPFEDAPRKFTKKFIDHLAKTINDLEGTKFTGVPLQLRILAEAFINEANDAKEMEYYAPIFENLNLIGLFEKFTYEKFAVYLKKRHLDISNVRAQDEQEILFHKFINNHQLLAFHMLFNGCFNQNDFEHVAHQAKITELLGNIMSGKEKSGIISDVVDDKARFIHRTFAEYFAANFLLRKMDKVNIQNFFLREIAGNSFNHQGVRYFFNGVLTDEHVKTEERALIFTDHTDISNIKKHYIPLALKEGNADIIRFFINSILNRGNVFKDLIDWRDDVNNTHLHLAAERGHLQIMQLLMEKGAKIDALNKFHKTALHVAARKGYTTIVKVLLQKGATVNDVQEPVISDSNRNNLNITIFLKKYLPENTSFSENEKTDSVLCTAAENGHLEVVKYLIEQGADITKKNYYGDSILKRACEKGHNKIAELLLGKKADFSTTDDYGNTPLHMAADYGHLEVTKLLIEQGADVNAKNNFGHTVLHFAARKGDLKAVKLLYEKGADINEVSKNGGTVLQSAVERERLAVVRFLIDNGADVNIRDMHGDTALRLASENGYFEIAKVLIEKGVSVNSSNIENNSYLYYAVEKGRFKISELLLANGADANHVNNEGKSIIYKAATWGHLDIMNLLLRHKADITLGVNNGNTVLHKAAEYGFYDIVETLLQNEPNINRVNQDGETVLRLAVEEGHLTTVNLLIEKGADITVTDNNGNSVLQIAAGRGYLDVVKLLVEHRANVLGSNNYGNSILHTAIEWNHVNVVEYLIEQKANISVVNKYGDTLLHFACRRGHWKIIKLLVSKDIDINAVNNKGETAITVAQNNKYGNVVKFLILPN